MARYDDGAWKPPIVSTSAATGEGISDLTAAIGRHQDWLAESGELARRRRARAREEVAAIAVTELRRRIGGLPGEDKLDELAGRVTAGELDPYAAADELIGD